MQPKKNNLLFMLIAGLLIVTVMTSIGFYISRPQTMALASGNIAKQSLPNQVKPVDISAQQSPNKLSQTNNDVTIEITSAKIIDTGIEIGICYTAVDNGEWYPRPGHLFYSAYEVYPDEIEFTSETKADKNNLGRRCALIRYRIDDLQNVVTPIQFSITGLYAPQREMYSACQEFQQRLDTNPKANAYGLKAKCTEMGNGAVSIELVDHGKSVNNEKAKNTLNEIAKGDVVGTWEFTITDLTK